MLLEARVIPVPSSASGPTPTCEGPHVSPYTLIHSLSPNPKHDCAHRMWAAHAANASYPEADWVRRVLSKRDRPPTPIPNPDPNPNPNSNLYILYYYRCSWSTRILSSSRTPCASACAS